MIVYILLILAAVCLVYSIYLTVSVFKCFGMENTGRDELKKKLVSYRNKVIASYAGTVVLITAAAVVKVIA